MISASLASVLLNTPIVWKHGSTSSMSMLNPALILSRRTASVESSSAGLLTPPIRTDRVSLCGSGRHIRPVYLHRRGDSRRDIPVLSGPESPEAVTGCRGDYFRPCCLPSCPHCTKATRAAEKQVTSELWDEFTRADPDVYRYKDGRRWCLSFGSPLFRNGGVEYRITVPATKDVIAASRPNTILTGGNAIELVRQYRKSLQGHFARCAHGVVFSTNLRTTCSGAHPRDEALEQ